MSVSKTPCWSDRLRQERTLRNWRQQDLADQLGTTVLTVQRWERGSHHPSAYFRVKLCALFEMSAEEFGWGEQAPPLPTAREDVREEPASTQASTSRDLPLWTVPTLRNPHFTGREELLGQLIRHLSPSGADTPIATRRAALTQRQVIKGLGGIGKTQIAIEYAYRAREQGHATHTIWINAASEDTIMASFVALAAQLPGGAATHETDQRKLVVAITRWLEQCQEPWLLIFDNADELDLIPEYFPRQGNGSILLTTRAHAVGSVAVALEVETMGLAEGTLFLLRRAQREGASDEERNEATNVVIALDGFPLALDQAGAYIEETGCSFEGYLQLYQQHRHTLLARRGKQMTNYPDSVAITWSLSFQQIEQTNAAAADLLRLCAFLAPDHIPEELLREGAPHWPPMLQEAVTDLFTFNKMLEELLRFSLVKRLVEEHMLSIHRLVQAVQRERMNPDEQARWARCVVYGVNAVFPSDPKNEIATWPRCQRYLEQVQICTLLIQHYGLESVEAADVLYRTAIYLSEHALYALAEPLYQWALRIWERQLGPHHLKVASLLNNLGELSFRIGNYAEAESLFQRALCIWREQLGPEHPNVATSLNDLAILYVEQGKYADAERFHRRALRIREEQLGEMHPNVASSLDNLALLYVEQGRYTDAEPLNQRALRIREEQLGKTHPNVASSLNNLALLYSETGRYLEAEHLLQRALCIWREQLGPEHPRIASPLNNLARIYVEQGKYADADQFYQQACHIWEQQLGPEHPKVALTLNNLGELYIDLNKYAEAEHLLQRALRIWEQQLGPEHHLVAHPLNNLAKLYMKQGKYVEAEPLYQRAIRIREQALGSEHP